MIGGVAIEDAAALIALFPRGVCRDDIPERLELYEKLRDERAHKIQDFTRQAGLDLSKNNRDTFNSELQKPVLCQELESDRHSHGICQL